MTIDFALAYIPRRMQELGFGNDYLLKARHLVLQAGEQREIDAVNQFFILVDEVNEVNITSEFGIYDLFQLQTNELQYEHQGNMIIKNYSQEVKHIRLIQAIPLSKN